MEPLILRDPLTVFLQIRRITGLKQLDLADLTGIHEQTISKFETRRRNLKLATFLTLVEAAGFEVRLFRTRTVQPPFREKLKRGKKKQKQIPPPTVTVSQIL